MSVGHCKTKSSREACEAQCSDTPPLWGVDVHSAPKDGTVILVEDTNESAAPWAAAKWMSTPEWSGWVYDDELLQDGLPLGPCPTLWLDVPQLPN